MRLGLVAVASCCSLIASACMPSAPPSPYQRIGSTAAPLRSAFNASMGKVRVLMLVAPT